MPDITPFIDLLTFMLPVTLTAITLAAMLWGAHKILIAKNSGRGNERLLTRQLMMLGLTLASLIIVVVVLPISDSTRNQILALIGIVLSGIIAFASTTVFSNIMAGFMLRVTKPFDTGDFITVGEYSGRVVERGLLDTEIQTEDRRLVSLPNIHVASNPVSVVTRSGALISTTLSIGYDVNHRRVEELLLKALADSALEDPFVQIISLDNFSVVYKANGLLKDPKTLISARSDLQRNILSCFHDNQIEIMSPTYVNQRVLNSDTQIIPARERIADMPEQPATQAEDVVFEKAEKAANLQELKEKYREQIAELEAQLPAASADEKKQLKQQISKYLLRIEKLKKFNPA